MNVLVTGGAGYIGSVIVEKLAEKSHRVVVLDDLSQGHPAAVSRQAVFVQADVGDAPTVQSILHEHKIEAVIHMAAASAVEVSMTNPAHFFNANVTGGLALLNAMLACGVKTIVFSSTAAVYGDPQQAPIREDHPTEPVNAYGESKLIFERILHWYHRAYRLNYVAFRYFNAAGAWGRLGESHHPESHLIPLVLQAASEQRGPVEVFGTDYPTPDGSCVRDFVHVRDIASAHVRALERVSGLGAGIYNLGSGRGRSVLEVVAAAERVAQRKIPVRASARRMGDPAVLVASADRAARDLGWMPEHSALDEIVCSAWRWHQENPHGYGPS